MTTPTGYTLFGHAVTRRMFYWSLFLCPGLVLMIYVSSRSRGQTGNLSPYAEAAGDSSRR